MYDTARRVELVKRQMRKNTRRRQKCGIRRLSAVCMLLFAALIQTADRVVGQGQTAAWGGFGAMLLREDAGGYVLVGVAAFAAAVVLTVVCMRLHEREKQRQHRTIPALRLKHRSGGCGTASALPKCSIIHKVLSALFA